MCKFLKIDVHVSVYEADPQVLYIAILKSLIPVSGDSDLLAYGLAEEEQEDQDQDDNPSRLSKLIVVKAYHHELYRIIDLEADVPEGEYPPYDLYCKHGKIVFQLYAACSGCDFTHTVAFRALAMQLSSL